MSLIKYDIESQDGSIADCQSEHQPLANEQKNQSTIMETSPSVQSSIITATKIPPRSLTVTQEQTRRWPEKKNKAKKPKPRPERDPPSHTSESVPSGWAAMPLTEDWAILERSVGEIFGRNNLTPNNGVREEIVISKPQVLAQDGDQIYASPLDHPRQAENLILRSESLPKNRLPSTPKAKISASSRASAKQPLTNIVTRADAKQEPWQRRSAGQATYVQPLFAGQDFVGVAESRSAVTKPIVNRELPLGTPGDAFSIPKGQSASSVNSEILEEIESFNALSSALKNGSPSAQAQALHHRSIKKPVSISKRILERATGELVQDINTRASGLELQSLPQTPVSRSPQSLSTDTTNADPAPSTKSRKARLSPLAPEFDPLAKSHRSPVDQLSIPIQLNHCPPPAGSIIIPLQNVVFHPVVYVDPFVSGKTSNTMGKFLQMPSETLQPELLRSRSDDQSKRHGSIETTAAVVESQFTREAMDLLGDEPCNIVLNRIWQPLSLTLDEETPEASSAGEDVSEIGQLSDEAVLGESSRLSEIHVLDASARVSSASIEEKHELDPIFEESASAIGQAVRAGVHNLLDGLLCDDAHSPGLDIRWQPLTPAIGTSNSNVVIFSLDKFKYPELKGPKKRGRQVTLPLPAQALHSPPGPDVSQYSLVAQKALAAIPVMTMTTVSKAEPSKVVSLSEEAVPGEAAAMTKTARATPTEAPSPTQVGRRTSMSQQRATNYQVRSAASIHNTLLGAAKTERLLALRDQWQTMPRLYEEVGRPTKPDKVEEALLRLLRRAKKDVADAAMHIRQRRQFSVPAGALRDEAEQAELNALDSAEHEYAALLSDLRTVYSHGLPARLIKEFYLQGLSDDF